jgi:hypothetical protein
MPPGMYARGHSAGGAVVPVRPDDVVVNDVVEVLADELGEAVAGAPGPVLPIPGRVVTV